LEFLGVDLLSKLGADFFQGFRFFAAHCGVLILLFGSFTHPDLGRTLAPASQGNRMIPIFPEKPRPFKDQKLFITDGISLTTIERHGRCEAEGSSESNRTNFHE
jgi:hypothetical protein